MHLWVLRLPNQNAPQTSSRRKGNLWIHVTGKSRDSAASAWFRDYINHFPSHPEPPFFSLEIGFLHVVQSVATSSLRFNLLLNILIKKPFFLISACQFQEILHLLSPSWVPPHWHDGAQWLTAPSRPHGMGGKNPPEKM